MFHLRFVLSLLLLIGSSACKKKDADSNGDSVAADSAKPIVDQDYRFKLKRPSADWRLLDADEIRGINPDALAGASGSQGMTGFILAERAPDNTDLDGLAAMLVEQMAIQDKKVQPTKQTAVGGVQAVETTVEGSFNGIAVHFKIRVLLTKGFAFQVLCYRVINAPGAVTTRCSEFFDAVELLEGDIKPRSKVRDVGTAAGVGWRVEERVFESAVARLRVAPPEGWSLLLGDGLNMANPDADIGLYHAASETYFTVLSEWLPGTGDEQYRKLIDANVQGKLVGEADAVRFAGRDMDVSRFELDQGLKLQLLRGLGCVEGRCYQFVGWAAAGGETLKERFQEAVAAVQHLSDANTKALRAELESEPDPQDLIGPGHSLRIGIYTDFTHQFRWKAPRGLWKFAVGDQAKSQHAADVRVAMTDLIANHFIEVRVLDASAFAASAHKTVMQQRFGGLQKTGADVPISVAGVSGFATRATMTGAGGVTFDAQVTTLNHGAKVLAILEWWPKAGKRNKKAVEGFGFGLPRAESRRAGVITDYRLGFELREPEGAWTYSDETPAAIQPVGRLLQWSQGRNAIIFMAINSMTDFGDEDWKLDFFEKLIRQRVGRGGKLEKSWKKDVTVAGRKGRRVSWATSMGDAETVMLFRGKTVYGFLAFGPSSSGVIDDLVKRLSLIDPPAPATQE